VGITAVHKHRHPQFSRQRKLSGKGVFLFSGVEKLRLKSSPHSPIATTSGVFASA
jgi:hypothetical protein